MLLSSFRQKIFGTVRKEIPLNLLSHLWVENKISEKAALQPPAANDWAHQDIHQFYNQYIAPNMTVLGTALPVIHQILSILDNAGDCMADMDDSEEEKMPVSITLREHSLCVARIAVDMIKKTHRDYDMILGKILIVCLGHGLGALSSAQTIGGLIAKTLLILGPLIQDLPFKQDIVLAILTFGENHPGTDGAKILKAASCAARRSEQERTRVLSKINRLDILDIQKIRAAIQPSQGK